MADADSTAVHSAGPKPKSSSTAAEKRKLRNRLSQQAFRARQHLEVNELKQRLAQFEGSESERNHRLARENQVLRKQLWQTEKRLRSLQATLKNIVDSMVEAKEQNDILDQSEDSQGDAPPSLQQHADQDSSSSSPPAQPLFPWTNDVPSSTGDRFSLNHVESEFTYGGGDDPGLSMMAADLGVPVAIVDQDLSGFTSLDEPSGLTPNATSSDSSMALPLWAPMDLAPSLPPPQSMSHSAIPSFATNHDNEPEVEVEDEMVPAVRTGTRKAASTSAFRIPNVSHQTSLLSAGALALNNYYPALSALSKYCQHIDAYETCVMSSSLLNKRHMDLKSLTRIMTTVVSSFVKIAWSGMESWMHYTGGNETLAKMTVWRIAPGPDSFAEVPLCMRPTALQAAVPHPAVIDWCVFPFLRDKLIQYHAADPDLDTICGDIGLAYVVQADLADLVVGAQSLQVNLSVHEIVQGMMNSPELGKTSYGSSGDRSTSSSSSAFHQPQELEMRLPAPNLRALLDTKEYAWALYRRLRLAQGGDGYRLDPALFAKYPHLYEPDPRIAEGVPLRSLNKIPWPEPRPLDNVAIDCYRRSCRSVLAHGHRGGAEGERVILEC